MKKIIDKWYLSLIIIPVLITYLTNFLTLPKLFNDLKLTVIFSLLIFVVILLIELKIVTDNQKLPLDSDKKIILKLFKKLNLKTFQEDIYMTDSWCGYRQNAIHNITEYQFASRLIKNKPLNLELQKLINSFNEKLDEFTDFTSRHVHGNNSGFLVPFKEHHDRNVIKKNCENMNLLAKNAFIELEKLVKYLKLNKYM